MLTTLRIKNLALVEDLTLELQPGCNVITGETGAGKSIIIGALNLVLGERADRSLIRSGSESCTVEAVFNVTGLRAPLSVFLEENGLEPCDDQQLVLKRTFALTGTNRQFVNGSATTLNTLAELGAWLVDMHGPHDHQSLLHPARQLAILDAYGDLAAERAAFGQLLRGRGALEAEKSALVVDEKTYAQQLDLLRFQVREIDNAALRADEEHPLEADFQRASNAARLLHLSQTVLELLSEGETPLLAQAGSIGRSLQELQRIDAGAGPLLELHASALATYRSLQAELSLYAEKVDADPGRLAGLEERLNLIHSLKRKYGPSLADVLSFGTDAKRRLQALESRDAELARLNAAIARIDADLSRAGEALTARRRKLIPTLARAASQQLKDLGFREAKFEILLTLAAQPLASGRDEVEFQFAPNPGEPAKPLRAIASSGEMARVMLALKTVLAAEDEIPVLVFDEVDANVGGETAHAVGEKMRQIGEKRQVLCITHLPQVAAPADAHYLVAKQVREGRTISEITLLSRKDRLTELARMLGGQSEAARRHAAELLKQP